MDSTMFGYCVDADDPADPHRLRSGTQVVRSGADLGGFALWLAEETRVARPDYTGLLSVYVWEHDERVHLRYGHDMVVPDEADRYVYPAGEPRGTVIVIKEERGPAVWGLM